MKKLPTNPYLQFKEDEFELRTPATHVAHCAGLHGYLEKHISTTFGVTRNSVLNSCRYFHVISGLVPDIMHDILEGTLPLVVKLLLLHYVSEKGHFSLSILNDRISSFNYGSSVKNKPSPISVHNFTSSGTKLKQSGTSVMSLF